MSGQWTEGIADQRKSPMIKSFRDLNAWRKADALAHHVFDLTKEFPREYLRDLTSQLRRASLSVPTNLAEGCATAHTNELLQFVNIARRSASETQYLLLFASQRGLISGQQLDSLISGYEEVQRILQGLISSLKRSRKPVTWTSPETASKCLRFRVSRTAP